VLQHVFARDLVCGRCYDNAGADVAEEQSLHMGQQEDFRLAPLNYLECPTRDDLSHRRRTRRLSLSARPMDPTRTTRSLYNLAPC
jgi:hypothetical protein